MRIVEWRTQILYILDSLCGLHNTAHPYLHIQILVVK